ncbi:hypothetical protein S245_039560, partial [Arachis hypogaea]
GVLKATSADPWSASFMVETRTKANTIGSESYDACFEHSNFFKITAPEARPGQLRPGAYRCQKGRDDRCTPTVDRSAQPKVLRSKESNFITLKNFQIMINQDIRPGLITYNALINGLCKICDLKEVGKFVNEMSEGGLKSDKIMFTTLIDGYCKDGDIKFRIADT